MNIGSQLVAVVVDVPPHDGEQHGAGLRSAEPDFAARSAQAPGPLAQDPIHKSDDVGVTPGPPAGLCRPPALVGEEFRSL
jgi:hypothetical protein